MDKLWAPWRIKYVSARHYKGCVFCKAAKHPSQGADFVVFKTKYSLCILNIFPYNNGHVMVCPTRHTRDISSLSPAEVLDLFDAVKTAKGLLDKTLKPDGYNMGINLSRAAGAGIVGHLHVHIVPRWIGDTNFMPVATGTKVISQSLKQLHKLLKSAYAKANTRVRR